MALLGSFTVQGAAPPQEVAEHLRRAVEQLAGTGQLVIAGQSLRSQRALPEIYAARGFRLLWTDAANQEALLGEIAAVAGEGLEPADYHFDPLREVLEQRRREPGDARLAAEADLLLTDALVRLAVHFHLGKVDPASGAPRWDAPAALRGEPAARLVTRIASGSALALRLGELRPVQPIYGRFKSALARYRLISAEGGWEPLPSGRILQAGMEDPRVPLLRRRLALTGDYPGPVIDSPHFEPALEQALRRFQTRHHLEPDGLFGPATRRAMNRSVSERKDQLRVNLERARWLLAEVRGLFLVVDPAGGQVVLMDNSQPMLRQRARFAPDARTAPEFRAELRYLVVHPDFILPPELVATQVAPLARRDPAQLAARGLQVFAPTGELVRPASVDWSRPADVIVRQSPGPASFLGAVRFPIQNPVQVFLHGGPLDAEALPGSVRLHDPIALARVLARPPASWGPAELAAALEAGQPRTLPLAGSLPVLFAPWTAWVDVEGTVWFRGGFEARDAEILTGLRRAPGTG